MAKAGNRNQANRSVNLISAEDVASGLGTSLMQISRWRRKLDDPDNFEQVYQQACARYSKLLEFDSAATKGLGLSLAEEWYTPQPYLDAAREVLGAIDLDPASSAVANERVRAATYYSAADNGLEREWPGRVWLNPPYSGLAGAFTERLVKQFQSGITTAAVLLVNAHSTDTEWFQPCWDYLLCFTNHRINFHAGKGQEESGSNHGSVFIYLGPERSVFIQHFAQFGAIVERACG